MTGVLGSFARVAALLLVMPGAYGQSSSDLSGFWEQSADRYTYHADADARGRLRIGEWSSYPAGRQDVQRFEVRRSGTSYDVVNLTSDAFIYFTDAAQPTRIQFLEQHGKEGCGACWHRTCDLQGNEMLCSVSYESSPGTVYYRKEERFIRRAFCQRVGAAGGLFMVRCR